MLNSLDKRLLEDLKENIKKILEKKGHRKIQVILISKETNQVMLFKGNNFFKLQDFINRFDDDPREILVFEKFNFEILQLDELIKDLEELEL